jgi:hypothetical protein
LMFLVFSVFVFIVLLFCLMTQRWSNQQRHKSGEFWFLKNQQNLLKTFILNELRRFYMVLGHRIKEWKHRLIRDSDSSSRGFPWDVKQLGLTLNTMVTLNWKGRRSEISLCVFEKGDFTLVPCLTAGRLGRNDDLLFLFNNWNYTIQ